MWKMLPLLLLSLCAQWTTADITGSNPAVGSCLCPNTGNIYVLDSPCGTRLATIGINQCFKYAGNSSKCTLDIEYEYFQIDFAGVAGWVVGNYMNLESTGYCSEFPCGAPNPGYAERIIGGSNAIRNAYPWQLAIEQDNAGTWELACGAALIDANWAVTAAHCVEDPTGKPLRIVAGVHDRTEVIDTAFQVRNINSQHIILHPDYNSTTLDNDIAILSIPGPYDLSTPRIRTVCLPPSSSIDFAENPSCHITGWGITKVNTTTMPQVLQAAGIDVILQENCVFLLNRTVSTAETCTLDQASRTASACTGDLGGPLSCAVNTRVQLAAVGSYPAPNCNPRWPQIYSSVPFHLDWIIAVTGVSP